MFTLYSLAMALTVDKCHSGPDDRLNTQGDLESLLSSKGPDIFHRQTRVWRPQARTNEMPGLDRSETLLEIPRMIRSEIISNRVLQSYRCDCGPIKGWYSPLLRGICDTRRDGLYPSRNLHQLS